MTTQTVGQGTVATTATAISMDLAPSQSVPGWNISGTAYTVTATPAAGWRLARIEATVAVADYSGTTRPETTTYAASPAKSNIDPSMTWNDWADDGYTARLFEGTVSYIPDPTTHYTYSNLVITAYFEQTTHTHLVIRDDTTGKIMIGGSSAAILRDD